jgi:dTDP-4-amino-4,6-dideoxygalactose transaminase
MNSGTDALIIGLRCLGVGPTDEVIVPALGFIACAEAVSSIGARPVFVDIDPRTFNLDPQRLEPLLSTRTRAILAVHLYGQAAAMGEIMAIAEQHGLRVLEDVAQALGATYTGRKLGSLGHAAALSFFPSKNLGAFGDAGLLATNDPALAASARALKQHGSRDKQDSSVCGYNSRLDSLQAAVLRVKLPKLDAAVRQRRAAATRYDELLAHVPGLQLPCCAPHAEHSFHQYTVRVEPARRERVQASLLEQGIQTKVYYPIPLHRLSVYRDRAHGALPHAEAACQAVLSLPIWPEIAPQAQQRVAELLERCLR